MIKSKGISGISALYNFVSVVTLQILSQSYVTSYKLLLKFNYLSVILSMKSVIDQKVEGSKMIQSLSGLAMLSTSVKTVCNTHTDDQ